MVIDAQFYKQENSTLVAIDKVITTNYPYAAALLIYCLFERIIKYYYLEHRDDGKIRLSNNHRGHDSEYCRTKCLKGLDLGAIRKKCRDDQVHSLIDDVTDNRNEIMHASLIVAKRKHDETDDELHTRNEKLRDIAISDLERTMTVLAGDPIISGLEPTLLSAIYSRKDQSYR